MKIKQEFLIGVCVFLITISSLTVYSNLSKLQPKDPVTIQDEITRPRLPEPEVIVETPKIANVIPGYQNYSNIIKQLREWEKEAPALTEVGIYGKSRGGKDLYYIKLTNKYSKALKRKVLIHGCLHGNESLATSVVMAYTGTLLSEYNKYEDATYVLDNREIYIIPVASPDTFSSSRHVEGVDPNRDFPSRKNPNKNSITCVKALQTFFLKHKFEAVISAHTWGRQFLYPWGDSYEKTKDHERFMQVLTPMGKDAQYEVRQVSRLYKNPIQGTEADWYYINGAFAIVMEMGTHQNVPPMKDVKYEFNRTYKAFVYFLREATLK